MRYRNPNDPMNTPDKQLGLEAADWLVRLQDRDPDREEPYPDLAERVKAFWKWLYRSADHMRAFFETMETDRRLHSIDPHASISVQALLADTAEDVVKFPHSMHGASQSMLGQQYTVRQANRLRWRLTLVASLTALAAMTIALALVLYPGRASTAFYTTGIGERQIITLDDGSVMTLNTSTRVAVTLDRHLREIHLLAGEALFDVRHHFYRPFRVVSDDVLLEDLGTQFDVYRKATGTQILVLQGRVQVNCACTQGIARPPGDGGFDRSEVPRVKAASTVTLGAGEQAEITVTSGNASLQRQAIRPEEMKRAVAWKDGALLFNGETLARAVEEFNRYSYQRLVVADPSIANLRVGGFYMDGDADGFVKALQVGFGILVLPPDPSNPDPSIIRLGRAPTPPKLSRH